MKEKQDSPSDLRAQAEALARQRAARTPEDSAALSPEEIQNTRHELRVHQIELEMQNEELRAAQAEIEASRSRYVDLYDLAPVGYCTLSEKGLILEADLTAAKLLGVERSDLTRRALTHFLLSEDQDVWYRCLRQLAATGHPQTCELRVTRSDGDKPWMHVDAAPGTREAGLPVACRVTLTDITARKRAEAGLRAIEAKYRTIVETTSEGVWVFDERGRTTLVNPQMTAMLGYSPAEMAGRPFEAYLSPEEREKRGPTLRECCRKRCPSLETRLRGKDGGTLWVRISGGPIVGDDGRDMGFFAMLADITERKQAEEQRTVTSEILRLLNSRNDSHELMRLVCLLLRDWSGCEAVGIRRRDGDDFPYFETNGLSDDFVESENRLCALDQKGEMVRDSDGNPVLECMCGNVIRGRTDPSLPFFTEFGSFWTNSTTDLLASTSEEDRQARTRNRCHGEGYESVLLVPLRAGGKTFGLLQFNDKRKGCFTPELVAFLEQTAGPLATGLAHRLAHKALHESEERYRTLAENTGDIIARFDRKYRHLYANVAAMAVTGLRPEAYLGKTHRELGFPPEQCDHWEDKIEEAFQTGRPVRDEVEYDGRTGLRTFHWVLTPEFGEDGSVVSVLSNVRDITERKQAEREVAGARDELKRILKLVPDMICTGTPDGRFLSANPAFEAVLGYSLEELIATSYMELIHPDDREATMAEVQRQLAGQPTASFVNRYRCKDGTYRTLEWYATPAVEGILYAAARDITERVRLRERLAQISEAEREGLRRDLHDTVCQRLAGAGLLVDHLREDLAEDRELAGRLDEVARLVRQSIEEAHLAGRRLEPLSNEPGALSDALASLASRITDVYGVSCRVTARRTVLFPDKRIGGQLLLIVQEAAINAAKHAAAGRIGISLSRRGSTIRLTVRDNGKGMPENEGERKGMGVKIMRERAALVGATLSIQQPTAGGTLVQCTWKESK